MVIDQVFGLVDGLSEVRTRTDAAGEFRLVGLPPALEPHQSLVVFVPQQDGKVPAAVAQVAWRSQPGELAIERSRRVDVDLPATRDVTLVDVRSVGADAARPTSALDATHNGSSTTSGPTTGTVASPGPIPTAFMIAPNNTFETRKPSGMPIIAATAPITAPAIAD